MQEVITRTVFAGFSTIYLNEPITLQHLASFALLLAGAILVFTAG